MTTREEIEKAVVDLAESEGCVTGIAGAPDSECSAHVSVAALTDFVMRREQAAYAAGQRAADERAAAIADAERAEFMAQAGRNDGRESDMAFGSVNSAERIAAAIRNRKEQG